MIIDVPQKVVCEIPHSYLDSVLSHIKEEEWYFDDYRNTAPNMQDTNTIPIKHTLHCRAGELPDLGVIRSIKKEKLYDKYYPLIKPILIKLKQYYEFNIYAAFLARLKPLGTIGLHKDRNSFLELCHRIHVPLQTSSLVEYIIEDKKYYWEKGKIYEFNNMLIHGVKNNDPDLWRIHLIINLYNLPEIKLDEE